MIVVGLIGGWVRSSGTNANPPKTTSAAVKAAVHPHVARSRSEDTRLTTPELWVANIGVITWAPLRASSATPSPPFPRCVSWVYGASTALPRKRSILVMPAAAAAAA